MKFGVIANVTNIKVDLIDGINPSGPKSFRTAGVF